MSKALIVPAHERPAPLNVGGFLITVLASQSATGGYEIFHQTGAEGKGPGPHYHPWDEPFFVISGELHCGVDELESSAAGHIFAITPPARRPGSLKHERS